MEEKISQSFKLLPWMIVIVLLCGFTILGVLYNDKESPLGSQSQKIQLATSMRINFLKNVEAEKNAVLATTDDASEMFADKARKTSNQVEEERKELAAIILHDGVSKEQQIMSEFDSFWVEFRKLDDEILKLATQNSNLKAQKLSSTRFSDDVQSFYKSLKNLIDQDLRDNQPGYISLYAYESITAAFQIFALQKAHIEEADDAKMDQMEHEMKTCSYTAEKALQLLRRLPELSADENLKNAESTYQQMIEVNAEILKLSRLNTNMKSSEMSLGKIRLITDKCQEILGVLQNTVESRQFEGTK